MNARQEKILARLRTQQSLTIAELTTVLGVSRETVRKDLYELEQQGLLTKVRGGAVLTAANMETAYPLRRTVRTTVKDAIARAAVELIAPGDTVFLDYGTTTFAIASRLAQQVEDLTGVTAVTCSIPIARLLAETPDITVMLPGGVVRGSEHSLHGPLATRNLRALHFDMCFLGCSGADPVNGFTSIHALEAEVSALAVERSAATVVVADHTKLGAVAPNVTATSDRPALLVTDTSADPQLLAGFRSRGLDVRVV